MAIKGLTDRGMAFPQIGQIRKGAKKTSNRPGKDLKYFRVEFAEGEDVAHSRFLSIYDTKPTRIRIMFPFNETERMWDPFLEAYTAGRMVARADGNQYIYLIDTKTNKVLIRNGQPFKAYIEDEPCGYDYKNNPVYCKANGRLNVFVPELERAAYMTMITTSIHDVRNISDQIRAFKSLNNGIIAGIPFAIQRRDRMVSVTIDGNRVRQMKSLVNIEADITWATAKFAEVQRLALPAGVVEGEVTELPPLLSGEEPVIKRPDTTTQAPEQPVPAEPEPEETNGGRPHPAEKLKEMLVEAASKYQVQIDTDSFKPRGRPETEPEVGQFTLRKNLEECFAANQKETRYVICKYLWGESSSTKLTQAKVIATIRWLNAKPEKSGGDWKVDANSVPEAHNLYTAALKAEGQLAMEVEDKEAEDEQSIEPDSQPE